ncbi:HNH endonuclease signature motif containing protein [Bacillus alkalicellulosilyticus]|uniref:HNH endonuclease signature motif containing protein n=1 Tax=Alkalihalobacterium alkalicellulosilyticum TaxID=1912214 RepID=UPI00111696F9|nr:HNH endonuclease signature motif containing protein [Bacillus alkalicellulosilyticus]
MYIKAKVKSVYNATINEPYNGNTQLTLLNTQNVKDDMSEYVFSNDYLMDKSPTSFTIDEEEALKRYLSDPTNLEGKSFIASSDIERPAPHFEDYRKVLGNPNSKANMHTAGHLSNAVINFWADDVITLLDKEASIGNKALAAGFILVRPAKLVDKALDLNKARRLNNSSSPSNTPSPEPKTKLTDKRSTDVNSAQNPSNKGKDGDDFVGVLKGESVHLKKVKMEQIIYTKRPPEDTLKLRKEFNNSVRKNYLKDFANDPIKVNRLTNAGLTEVDIARMKKGLTPEGWQVHHKLPLDDGGTNAHDNLILIKNDPFHKAITNKQNELTRGLEPGQSKTISWPIPNGNIYPPEKNW